jgi:hypothetical protein
MTKSKYSLFQTFTSQEEVLDLNLKLSEEKIRTRLHDNNSSSQTIVPTGHKEYSISVHEDDYVEAKKILKKEISKIINEISKEHYLYDFTNEELFDILFKKDEWSELDFQLSIKILNERGEKVDKKLLKKLEEERLNSLKEPKKDAAIFILIGYLLLVLGPVLGIIWGGWIRTSFLISGPIIGFTITNSISTLPNGEKKYSFNKNDRLHGKWILGIGVVLLFTLIVLNAIGLRLIF